MALLCSLHLDRQSNWERFLKNEIIYMKAVITPPVRGVAGHWSALVGSHAQGSIGSCDMAAAVIFSHSFPTTHLGGHPLSFHYATASSHLLWLSSGAVPTKGRMQTTEWECNVFWKYVLLWGPADRSIKNENRLENLLTYQLITAHLEKPWHHVLTFGWDPCLLVKGKIFDFLKCIRNIYSGCIH